MRREARTGRLGFAAVASGALLFALVVGGLAVASASTPALHPSSSSVEFVNVSATSSYQFQPAQFFVTPGATVHLAVTQLADFAHTFTLSSVRNATIPSSDTPAELYQYFQTNRPILNLTLDGTVGFVNSTTFIAPAAGVYEYVCTEPGHFQSGMKGFMNSTTTPPASSSSSTPLTTYLVIGVALAVVVVIVAVVLILRARGQRGKSSPPS